MAVQESSPLGGMLRHYRRALGLTQEELAERAGLSERAIREIERGDKHVPRRETVRLLADALELTGMERESFQSLARRVNGLESPGALGMNRTNLPDQPTPFIGREREIQEIGELLQRPTVRLVTLTGTGGIGKSRLALQVAARLLPNFEDGVFLVSLDPLNDPGLVPSAMAEIVGVQERKGVSLFEALTASLQTKHLLLVLDNLEHLLGSTSRIGELLDTCRALSILVTSRISLHLAREHEYAVPPLVVPDPHQLPTVDQLSRYEAVALFVERAQAVRADFALTAENAPAVVEVCSRLDGLPLAIVLAAARIKLFPPAALLQRLSNRLTVLTGGARDLPARHQTLRGAIDWSYSLLSEEEQALFARLSVFAGGCTLEAAEAICAPERDVAFDVMDRVASLVDKSLLLQEGEQEYRFRMLETIREYAAERLEASGSAPALQRKHAMIYVLLAQTAASKLRGPQQVEWLRRLELEQDNLRAALQWSLQSQELELGLQLAASLYQFWLARGYRAEGERWLEGLLERSRCMDIDISPATRAKALSALSALALSSDPFVVIIPWLEESVALSRTLGDKPNTGEALVLLATAVLYDQGDLEQVTALSEESLSLGRELNDRRIIALSLLNLASVAWSRQEFTRQRELLEESVRLLRDSGDLGGMVAPLEIAAWGAFTRGDFERAATYFAELRAVCQELGNQPGIVSALFGLGTVARERGEYEHAGELFAEGITVAEQTDDKDARGRALLGLGDLALDLGDIDRVDILCTEGLAIFRSIGDAIMTASALHTLGWATSRRGDFARAAALFREALTIAQEAGFEPMGAQVMASLGFIAREQGDESSAAAWLAEGLRRMPPGASSWWTPAALEWLAGVLNTHGQPWRAARLLGAADSLRARIGLPIWPPARSLYDRDVRDVRAELGDEGFQAAWEEGCVMTVEQAIDYGLQGTTSCVPSDAPVAVSVRET